jgi:hypothetical protein
MQEMKIKIALMLILCTAGTAIADNSDGQEMIYPYLREGFLYNGVNGTISRNDETGKWNFAADEDLTDTRGVIKAGDNMEMLLSGCLENMIAEASGNENALSVKMWAKVTRYSNRNLIDTEVEEQKELVFDKNYLFPMLFIPMSDIEQSTPTAPSADDSATKQTSRPSESSSDTIIPAEVMEKLKPRRLPNLAKLTSALKQHGDITIFDRTGFIQQTKAGKVFEIDGLGRGVDGVTFRLLNSETLERIERKLGDSPGKLRFRVAGIVTKYKSHYYLLLQRAARTYSHGNFAR